MLELIEAHNIDDLTYYIFVRAAVILACWSFMIMANMIDFWSGTSTARALGERLHSHGFRRTIKKIGDYARVMFFFFMFDALGSLFDFYTLPFATMLCTAATIIIEGKSVFENGKRKKANAAEVLDVLKQIAQAATKEESKDVLQAILSMKGIDKKE